MNADDKRNLQIVEGDLLSAFNDLRRIRGLEPLDAMPEPPFCSFCGEGKNQVGALVEGLNAYIAANALRRHSGL